MPEIFRLPIAQPLSSSASLMAGSKLYFYTTATSVPQAIYQDLALSAPATNPLIADANGVFAQTFLINTPRYRVVLKTSADVTLFTWDDVGPDTAASLGVPTLAGSNVFTGTTNKLSSSEPRLLLDETDAGTDKRLWDIDIDGAVLKIRTRTTADGAGVDAITITRGATTAVTSVDIPTLLISGGTPATGSSGSFTATLTGMTVATTGTVKYRIVGTLCMLYVEANITGTSNTTAMTLTGLPVACQPNTTAQHKAMAINVTDNSVTLVGEAFIDGQGGASPGTITFGLYSTTSTANRLQGGAVFTNSGSKGLANGFQMIYSL